MQRHTISPDALARARALRDLTDPAQGPHAMQLLLDAVVSALAATWRSEVLVHRADPVVTAADNYDRLHYPPDGAARDARYTRWISDELLLRTQTSALVPPLLRRLAEERRDDVLLVCPGLVYRRDAIDRLHVGEPHQVDLWRVRRGAPLGPPDLAAMADVALEAALPGRRRRAVPAVHPYTVGGRQLDVADGGAWIEVGECGVALPALLAEAGLGEGWTGLALGLGLDRLLMLRKGLDDIRLLRDEDPRVAAQLRDLSPWRPVSRHPPIRRDLSIAAAPGATAEDLGDRVRAALGPAADHVEEVRITSDTAAEALPPAAAARLGIRPGQRNLLVRLVLRHPSRALTAREANRLRDAAYAALHEGTAHAWAEGPSPHGPLRP